MKNFKLLITTCLFFLTVAILGQQRTTSTVNDTTYMLTYDHGGLILWGSEHFQERMQNAIEWLDKYPTFKIGLENEAQIYDYFFYNEPSIIDEIKKYLQEYKGRFSIGSCTYGQPLSIFISDESNVRQISYALNSLRKHFNYRPPVYLMSEHAMHSQIPQIINGFDFSGAIMRTHFMMYGYNPTFDVPIGWWVGIDGSKIPTIPTYVGEGAEFAKTTIDTWILTRYPSKDSKEPMEYFREKFKHINPLLASRADDSGLRKEELVREYETKPKFSWVLLDDLMEKYPVPTVDMVTKPNDFIVRMPWGYCGNEIWNNSREAEVSVLTAERLAALEYLSGGQSYIEKLDVSWKNLLLSQHHDIQIVGLIPEARKLLPVSLKNSQETINESMSFFADQMKGEGFKQITVFNPLSWKQTRWISANIALHKGEAKNFEVKCGEKRYPVLITHSNKLSDGSVLDARIVFKVELPPLSLTSYSIVAKEENEKPQRPLIDIDKTNTLISTPYYEVKLATDGGIQYIKNIETGEFITNSKGRSLFFEGKIDGENYTSKGKWIITQPNGTSPWIKIVEYGFISSIPYNSEVIFYDDNPRIDYKVKFDFNGQKIGLLSDNQRDGHSSFVHEEKLRFKFFTNLNSNIVGIRDLPFAISETADKYIEGNYWTAVSDGKSGIAYFNKGNMGSIRESDNSFSIPLAYAMYYVWGTRMLYGEYAYEFAILPFKGSWQSADLHKKALEYSFTIPTIESQSGNNKLGHIYCPFNMEAENDVIMTALYPNNNQITARFFKTSNMNQSTSIIFEKNGAMLKETNLDGKFIKYENRKLDFKPWEIRTFQIENK
jgi:hypothetical protein